MSSSQNDIVEDSCKRYKRTVEADEGLPGGEYDMANQIDLQSLAMNLLSNDQNLVLYATTRFRKLLSTERNPPIDEVIQSGAVSTLIFMMDIKNRHFPRLQFEAAWALTNIASGTSEHTRAVLPAIRLFVRLLGVARDDVQEQVVWALGNICGDSIRNRDQVIACGGLTALLAQINEDSSLCMLRNAAWTLSNFCRGERRLSEAGLVLEKLFQLLNLWDDEVMLTDACWALTHLSDGKLSNDKIQDVVNSGVCTRLLHLLKKKSLPSVHLPAMQTVRNIVSGNDIQIQYMIDLDVLPLLRKFLIGTCDSSIKSEACQTVSNIMDGDSKGITAVFDAKIIGTLFPLLGNEDIDVQKEAARALSNATHRGSDAQFDYIVGLDIIEALCNLFKSPDPKTVIVSLEGLEYILKKGRHRNTNHYAQTVARGLEINKLRNLAFHEDDEISKKAKNILKKYFP